MSNHHIVGFLSLLVLWGISGLIVLPVSVSLVLHATLIVFLGSHRAVKLLLTEEEGGISQENREVVSASDAYKFPFIGSFVLFSLYLVFKYLDKEVVNVVVSVYFALVSVFTVTYTLSPIVSNFIANKKQYGFKTELPVVGKLNFLFTLSDFLSFIVGTIVSYFYYTTKHFMINNFLAISFCVQTMERISLGSYKVGAILLVGLFFYDIFWVFGTDVMVTVAKSFDGPIKLLFPRVMPSVGVKGEFSLLGLGDIVIPGLFIAGLLRYDAIRSQKANDHMLVNAEFLASSKFDKSYFYVNLLSYALGLVVTVCVMHLFNSAQPALLYLVPACVGSSLLLALAQGNFNHLIFHDEELFHKKKHDSRTKTTEEKNKSD